MQYYSSKEKDAILQIRLPLELREDFKKVCKQNNIIASALIRQLITQWMENQQQPINTNNNQ